MNKKTVIITGGNKGIGLGITESFVKAGYNVVIGARSSTDLSIFGDAVKFLSINVQNEDDHVKLAKLAIDWTGRLDVYINNAGFSQWKPLKDIDEAFFNSIMNTNLKGAFWGCKIANEKLSENGVIINISSIAGKRGSANNSMYVASKFAMNGLTQSLAKELGSKGIRVNGVCPVLILTEGLREALMEKNSPANGNPDLFIEEFTRGNSPLGRMPSSKEVGDTCVFLASENASAITGQNINVDCGVFPQ